MLDATTLADALAEPPDRVGTALLKIQEDQWFERKSGRVNARDLSETLIALANSEGGTVVVGLHGGHIEGARIVSGRLNDWRQAGIDYCDPPVRVAWREIPCVGADGLPNTLLVGDVPPSPVVHASPSDQVFLRVGDENRRLSFAQRQELVYDKGQTHFDGTAVDETVAGLDLDQVRSYAAAIGSSDGRRALAARGLVLQGKPTVAAWLLFATQPQALFPSAYVRVIRYQGTTKETGRRQGITEDVRCEGPITKVIEQAEASVERLEPHRRVLGSEGRFVVAGLIPKDAWREGIVNAVVHRSYSLDGDHIRVEIFDDRIEIESPGRFPGLTRISDFPDNVTRFARNPRIARASADLRFGQELGEGIRRIYDEMRLRGLAEPLYSETQASVRLVLSSLIVRGNIVGQLPVDLLRLIDIVRQGRHLSTGEIGEAAGTSRPTTVRRLRRLAEMGYVEWIGKSPSDPRAFWQLKTE